MNAQTTVNLKGTKLVLFKFHLSEKFGTPIVQELQNFAGNNDYPLAYNPGSAGEGGAKVIESTEHCLLSNLLNELETQGFRLVSVKTEENEQQISPVNVKGRIKVHFLFAQIENNDGFFDEVYEVLYELAETALWSVQVHRNPYIDEDSNVVDGEWMFAFDCNNRTPYDETHQNESLRWPPVPAEWQLIEEYILMDEAGTISKNAVRKYAVNNGDYGMLLMLEEMTPNDREEFLKAAEIDDIREGDVVEWLQKVPFKSLINVFVIENGELALMPFEEFDAAAKEKELNLFDLTETDEALLKEAGKTDASQVGLSGSIPGAPIDSEDTIERFFWKEF